MVRVLLAEAHSHLRAALHEYLVQGGEVVCGTADTSEAVWSRLGHEQWDVVILDVCLPGQTKLETVRKVHGLYPKLPILVISFARDIALRHWQEAGASGFISKARLYTELSEAVRVVSGGEKYFYDDEDE
jgi:DNA-binding NarL/FixJ family response regulator